MNLCELNLENFRNYKKAVFRLSDKLTVVVGPNGVGKTNLLEAIYMLSVGKSFRADLEAEIISYGENLARITGEINTPDLGEQGLEIMVTDGSLGITRKKLLVNGVARRTMDFVGQFRSVLFGPWDMELIDGSPAKRRNFLDLVISQIDFEYRRTMVSYEKGLRQRNRLLEAIREGTAYRGQLFFWDKLVIKNGEYITRAREQFIDFLNLNSDPVFSSSGEQYCCVYDRSTISESRLKQYESEEVAAATTLVGPHRDDFTVTTETTKSGKIQNSKFKRDVSKFGSRGEQRMAVLWLKMGELAYIEKQSGSRATLLLDDMFSELDSLHREIAGRLIGGRQTLITSADEHILTGLSGETIRLPLN